MARNGFSHSTKSGQSRANSRGGSQMIRKGGKGHSSGSKGG